MSTWAPGQLEAWAANIEAYVSSDPDEMEVEVGI